MIKKVEVKKYAVEYGNKKQEVTWDTTSKHTFIHAVESFAMVGNSELEELIEALQAIKEKQEELNA